MIFETRHQRESTLKFHEHRVAFATIVLSGSYTEVRDCVPYSCATGSVVIHESAEQHADHFFDDALCLNVEVSEVGGPGVVVPDAPLQAAVEQIAHAYYYAPETLDGAVTAFCSVLATHRHVSQPRKPDWLDAVLHRFPWCEDTPLREAATLAGVHPVQFSRAFHKHVGMTPNVFRRRMRLRRASELLLATSVPLTRIAHSCGFADQSHLTNTFTEALRLSPARYRRVFAR